MRKRKLWKGSTFALLAVFAIVGGGTGTVFATTSSSSSYQITESQFNAGSNAQSCSTQYCAQVTIGDPTDSKTTSSSSFTETKDDTTPVIELIIDPGESDLGTLTSEHTASKTTIIRIRTYLSGGYILQIMGDPPKFQGHTLAAMTDADISRPGREQFGINLAANTTPSVGAEPVQVPDNGTIFGVANDDYKTANFFKYVSGEVVAHSLTDSGRTDYTMSTIINISTSTPAGHYSGDFAAIVMPAY